MGTKKIIKKQQKTVFFVKKIQPGHRKELILLIKIVFEDILVYHLRLKENFFFFLKKKFQKSTIVNFVGSDPRLLEIGAKWRTHWAIILKVKKKIKGVRGLAQEAQPSDLYPYATKSDTWVQKKSSKNSKKQFFLFKKFNQDIKKSWSY